MKKMLWLLGVVAAVLLGAAPVFGKGAVGIGRVPYTITSPGMYYLKGNVVCASTTDSAITIGCNNVTLDLMGLSLRGPGRHNGNTSGIYIHDASNVEVRNGSIEDFGNSGVNTTISYGIRLINLRVRRCASGLFPGINSNLIKDCLVQNCDSAIYAYYSIIRGNQVSGCTWSIDAFFSTVADNTVVGNYYGIGGDHSTITCNTAASNDNNGIEVGPNCTITNNTTQGLSYGGNCSVAQNTVY